MSTSNRDRLVRLLAEMEGPVTLDAGDVRRLVEASSIQDRKAVEWVDAGKAKNPAIDFGRWVGGRVHDGFPSGRRGDISGYNGLFRINWFNGRYLTAEAFKAQDIYVDQRNRILARIFPQGVSWGLGLSVPGAEPPVYSEQPDAEDFHTVTKGGTIAGDEVIVLGRGEALDSAGRPIVVGSEFRFCFNDLVRKYLASPRIVTRSETGFIPCICLNPDPDAPRDAEAAIRPGPYLLCIEAEETPQGEAARYGDLCGHERSVHCEADGWRGGFGLSLARFPVALPGVETIRSAFDLRGVLAAYYFNVFEHNLISRWDRSFARDRTFCRATGPSEHEASCVPLAMVYVAEDGSLVFLDPWIPRRPLSATASSSWCRSLIGSPPDAALIARAHQFQCQLAQSLFVSPLDLDPNKPVRIRNLYERGFRNIPPVGFLPIEPVRIAGKDPRSHVDPAGHIGAIASGSLQAALVLGAKVAARTYFKGTTVFTYTVVALHDDDILEDVGNAFDKDPIVVRTLKKEIADKANHFPVDGGVHTGIDKASLTTSVMAETAASMTIDTEQSPFLTFVRAFGRSVALAATRMDDLVNRRLEVVKVIIPLQGLDRPHPVLGPVSSDAMPALRRMILEAFGVDIGELAPDQLASPPIEGLRRTGLPRSIPREFVVYVKQRLVLLDVLYLMLVILTQVRTKYPAIWSPNLVGSMMASGVKVESTPMGLDVVRDQLRSVSDSDRAMIAAAMAVPETRRLIAEAAVEAAPSLARTDLWVGFEAMVDERAGELAGTEPSPEDARRKAAEEVAEAFAAERPEFEPIVALSLVLSPEDLQRSLTAVKRASERTQASIVPERDLPIAETEFGSDRPPVFSLSETRLLYGGLRTGFADRKASDFVAGLQGELTVGEVLRLPKAEASDRLGGEAKLRGFLRKAKPALKTVQEGVQALSEAKTSKSLQDRLAELVKAGKDPEAALDTVVEEFANSDANRAFVAAAKRVSEAGEGGKRAIVAHVLRRTRS